jgi:hypothetical protein
MHAFTEVAWLLVVVGIAVFVLPTLLRVVTQAVINVTTVLVVCYVVALFYTGTVTLSDVHAAVVNLGPSIRSAMSAAEVSLSRSDSWITQILRKVNVF